MKRKYYRILNNEQITDRWSLDEPILDADNIDIWDFTSGNPILYNESIKVPIQYEGPTLDFTFAAFDIPVVSTSLGDLIQRIGHDNIQRISANIDGVEDQFEILIIKKVLNCFDRNRSEFTKWKIEDGRPEKKGQLRMVTRLFVDSSQIGENIHIFRIQGWEIALIVSEKLKRMMETLKIKGVKFQEV